MADISNEYDVARESCVYVTAKMQGNLERIKGVLGGKSKQWSSLQGSTLYLQKKQGAVTETIDLKDALVVRRVGSEFAGTQFEICMKKKKNHIFICPSSEECTAWVQALQNAMVRKDISQESSPVSVDTTLITDDKNIYNEVDETLVSVFDGCNPQSPDIKPRTTFKISDYTEPYDGESGAGKRENDYWDIADVRGNQGQSQAHSESLFENNKSKTPTHISAGQIFVDATSESATKSSYCQESIENNYSQVCKVKKTSASQEASKTVHTISASGNDMASKDEVIMDASLSGTFYSTVERGDSNADTNANSTTESNRETLSGAISGEGDKLFLELTNALSDRSSPVQEYIHPLTEEDRKPVEELTIFLSNHREICRVSYSYVPINSDPVSSLKSYLQSLDISL